MQTSSRREKKKVWISHTTRFKEPKSFPRRHNEKEEQKREAEET